MFLRNERSVRRANHSCFALAGASIALLAVTGDTAHAENALLFSNLPVLGKNCWIGRTVTGPFTDSGYQAHAFFFTPRSTDTLEYVLAPILAHTNTTTNAITISLTTAKNGTADFPGGVPDTDHLLEQWSITNAPIQDLDNGEVVQQSDPNMIIGSMNHPLLTADVGYWLIGTAPGDAVMDWNTSLAEEGDSTGFVAVATSPPSPGAPPSQLPTSWTQYGSAAQQGAFRIYGSTVVPESSALPLTVTGLMVIGLRLRKRRH